MKAVVYKGNGQIVLEECDRAGDADNDLFQ